MSVRGFIESAIRGYVGGGAKLVEGVAKIAEVYGWRAAIVWTLGGALVGVLSNVVTNEDTSTDKRRQALVLGAMVAGGAILTACGPGEPEPTGIVPQAFPTSPATRPAVATLSDPPEARPSQPVKPETPTAVPPTREGFLPQQLEGVVAGPDGYSMRPVATSAGIEFVFGQNGIVGRAVAGQYYETAVPMENLAVRVVGEDGEERYEDFRRDENSQPGAWIFRNGDRMVVVVNRWPVEGGPVYFGLQNVGSNRRYVVFRIGSNGEYMEESLHITPVLSAETRVTVGQNFTEIGNEGDPGFQRIVWGDAGQPAEDFVNDEGQVFATQPLFYDGSESSLWGGIGLDHNDAFITGVIDEFTTPVFGQRWGGFSAVVSGKPYLQGENLLVPLVVQNKNGGGINIVWNVSSSGPYVGLNSGRDWTSSSQNFTLEQIKAEVINSLTPGMQIALQLGGTGFDKKLYPGPVDVAEKVSALSATLGKENDRLFGIGHFVEGEQVNYALLLAHP